MIANILVVFLFHVSIKGKVEHLNFMQSVRHRFLFTLFIHKAFCLHFYNVHYGIQKFTLKFTLNTREGLNICDRDNWPSQKKCFKDTVLFTSFWICRKYLLITYFCCINVSCMMNIQPFTNCLIFIVHYLINPLFHMSQEVLGHFLKV